MSLRITNEWCHSVGLSINSSKTTIVPVTKKRKISNMKDIRLDGTLIECKSEVKCLGITLDKKLLWSRNIALTTNKATMICRNLAGKRWGCNPNILRWLCISIVRPTVTYAAIT
ncbi:putative unfolded protein binding protein [Trypoxylus dichotomus]